MFEYLIAFGAGLISFLSPCVLPLIPGYISYISGQSLQEILNQKKINFFPLILFCLGFSTVFVLLGASASFLGQALLQNSEVLRISAGIVIIIFSLQLMLELKLTLKLVQYKVSNQIQKLNLLRMEIKYFEIFLPQIFFLNLNN